MKSNIFIPTRINVGFQNRSDTYTQKLAYIIYWDANNKLRKETSWQSWRDSKIPNEEFDNVPTSNFVLNKKAGGYSTGWNHRQTYCRVFDSRGFEFEITIPNLLYILENATSTKGKGLEGEFIYGWDGKDLILIPCESPDYIEMKEFNDIVHEKNYIKSKELILGAKYKTKQNEELIYMGRFDYHYHYYKTNKGKHYFFAQENVRYDKTKYMDFTQMKSISGRIISVIDENCIENYAELMEQLEGKTSYSPYDVSKDEFIPMTFDEFILICKACRWNRYFLTSHPEGSSRYNSSDYNSIQLYPETDCIKRQIPRTGYYGNTQYEEFTYEEAYNKYKPFKVRRYLANGKFYEEVKK